MSPQLLLILYSALIVGASLAGGLAPSLLRLSHRSLQFALSFVAGVMLGVGLFHLLPHAVMIRAEGQTGTPWAEGHNLLDPIMVWVAVGFLSLFLLERFSHFHHHEPIDAAAAESSCAGDDHAHGSHHGHAHAAADAKVGAGRPGAYGWFGALVGLGVHCLLEGVALAASVAVGVTHGGANGGALAGVATFLVIVLHKPFDSMTLALLMRRAGSPLRTRVFANILLAVLVPAGVGLFYFGAAGDRVEQLAPIALAFSAGMFICIASSDLLPELQFHRHDRVGLSIALTIGLAFALVLGRFEASTHTHVDGHHHDHSADHVH
ncbi:MAG: ZIP family metal transporter [Phycisphaerales bacterium]